MWGEFSNMAAGFPLILKELNFKYPETLYQSLRFPEHPEIQEKLLAATNPMIVKKIAREHIALTRSNWSAVRVPIMAWVLSLKTHQHPVIAELLLSTADHPIVEYSSQPDFWAANPKNYNLHGVNALGKLWMWCRDRVKNNDLKPVQPNIDKLIILQQII